MGAIQNFGETDVTTTRRNRMRVSKNTELSAWSFASIISRSFDSGVQRLKRSTRDLAQESIVTTEAVAKISALGDRIDRVQNENRSALGRLLRS